MKKVLKKSLIIVIAIALITLMFPGEFAVQAGNADTGGGMVPCPSCLGTGKCSTCNGTGERSITLAKEIKNENADNGVWGMGISCETTGGYSMGGSKDQAPAVYESISKTTIVECRKCSGTGVCADCNGTGNVKKSAAGNAAPEYEKNVLTATVDGEDCIFYLGTCFEDKNGMWVASYISYSSKGEKQTLFIIYLDPDELNASQSSGSEEAIDMICFAKYNSTGEVTEKYGAAKGTDMGDIAFQIESAGKDGEKSHWQGQFDADLDIFGTTTKNKAIKIENAVFDFTLNEYYEKSEEKSEASDTPGAGEEAETDMAGSTRSSTNGSTISNASGSVSKKNSRDNVCSYCGGHGECEKCAGLGDCDYCFGEGYVACNSCGGSGMCQSCYGMGGKDKYSYGDIKWIECSRCGGSGDCSRCGGAGEQECGYCKGRGTCSYCKGSAVCSYCGGTGER